MHYITYLAAAVFFAGVGAFSLYEAYRVINKKGTEGPALPGPKLLPFIGRIHDLPIQYMWLKFKEWSDIYGPIYYTEMLGAKFVIISDEKIAEELLINRAKHNSDRPQMRSVTDSKSTDGGMEYLPLMGRNRKTLSLPVGDLC
jgi:Cytochrome P450